MYYLQKYKARARWTIVVAHVYENEGSVHWWDYWPVVDSPLFVPQAWGCIEGRDWEVVPRPMRMHNSARICQSIEGRVKSRHRQSIAISLFLFIIDLWRIIIRKNMMMRQHHIILSLPRMHIHIHCHVHWDINGHWWTSCIMIWRDWWWN